MDGDIREVPANITEDTSHVPEFEKLFGKACEIKHIDSDDVIPIGGNMFSDELTTGVTADFEHFAPLIQQMSEQSGKYNLAGLKQWLNSSGIDVDAELFAKLYAFTQVLEKKYPINPNSDSTRDAIYAQVHGGRVTLSQYLKVVMLNVQKLQP